MHLPRHTIESHVAVPLFQHASFCSPDPTSFLETSTDGPSHSYGCDNADTSSQGLPHPAIFTCASLNGFLVAQTDPLKLVANRSWSSSQGGLSHALPLQHTSLLFLVGGGRVPRFAPNKVILWDEAAEYTVKQPSDSADDRDSDDDDELGSLASRRASTIFSAGSEFDAYGKARPGSSELRNDQAQDLKRSSSAADTDSVRSSASSLVDAQDPRGEKGDTKRDANDSPSYGDNLHESNLNHSMASSLGIGRLQASHVSDYASESSMTFDDLHAGMASSTSSHSIMASSANLADPFAEEDARSASSSPTTDRPTFTPSALHKSRLRPGSSSRIPLEQLPSSSQCFSSYHRVLSSPKSRQSGPGLVDSVSSMATTATNATAKAQPAILRGREVAELEFSEVVRGIYATSIHSSATKAKEADSKGKGRASIDAAKSSNTRISIVLVVLLSSKAIIFEVSPPLTSHNFESTSTGSAWRIQKRATLPTHKNPKGLGSVAPFYETATSSSTAVQPSAIVAVPGRQKGHVQLLHLKLQNLATVDPHLNAANAASSVGAASIIVAHESSLAAITLSPNGRFLSTASSKGTLIRVWSNNLNDLTKSNVNDGIPTSQGPKRSTAGRTGFGARLVRELRRGTDPATILSIAFAPDASLVAAASDKGTIHIFLLTEPAIALQDQTTIAQAGLSPSSSSRAASLGRAAAHYLPSGIGNLAGQIPSSVLPQYLKSEWSSAQFRIPLKTFGASSRHHTSPSTKKDGTVGGPKATTGMPVGTDKSTEGAWAQMRSRISDIRRGEASVDEKIFLCWISESSPAPEPVSSTVSKGARRDNQRAREVRSRSSASQPATHIHGSDTLPAKCDARHQYRLIALTTSGGWYKLAVTLPQSQTDLEASGSTVLDMYRRDASSPSKRAGSEKPPSLECRLVEFRPMVALLDGWRA